MELTDEQIGFLLDEPKNWPGRKIIGLKREYKYLRGDKVLESRTGNYFRVFIRLNTEDPLDFSVGLVFRDKLTGEEIKLLRCNGPSHSHPNRIEQERLDSVYHIHKATERYMKAGMKAESWAFGTEEYDDIHSALTYLSEIANIQPSPTIKYD